MPKKRTIEETSFGPVRILPGPNRGAYPNCHSLFIEGPGVIVDPSSDRDRLKRLREEATVKAVWLSHWHEDHLAHLDLFDDLPLFISAEDAPALADMDSFLDWYGIEEPAYRRHWRELLIDKFHFRPRRPAGFLEDGQTIEAGGMTIRLIAAPGHTPGARAIHFPEAGVLFMADYDLTSFGPWYGDRGSSMVRIRETIDRLRQIEAKVWLTSHGPGVYTEMKDHLWDDYLAVIDRRDNRLLELLKEPRTMDQIIEAWIVYGRAREPAEFFRLGERIIMGHHLDHHLAAGRVVREGERFRLV